MANQRDSSQIPVFDGHNDTVLDLASTGRSFYERSETGHLDRVRATEGGMVGGFFAVFVPDMEDSLADRKVVANALGRSLDGIRLTSNLGSPSLAYATLFTQAMVSRLFRIESGEGAATEHNDYLDTDIPVDPLTFIHSASDLEENVEDGVFSAILHFEGAEVIDEHLYSLDTWYAAGLRSLGLVWSRPNIFASGVPFEFDRSPDTGPGLTDLGKALVHRCNELGVMIDLSHLNEKGFWDVAAITDAPLVATHSNAWAICPSTRNLTDKQLDAIAESDGMVGVNYHVGFLRPDGERDSNTPLEVMADHVDYLVERLGIDRVGLGSDFDGAMMPKDLSDASKLPNLINLLRTRGYDDVALRKIGYQNWVRVLRETWGF